MNNYNKKYFLNIIIISIMLNSDTHMIPWVCTRRVNLKIEESERY